jgi:hypothetical protein
VIFWYIYFIPQFLRHQTMDKVQKYNSFNERYCLYSIVNVQPRTAWSSSSRVGRGVKTHGRKPAYKEMSHGFGH